MSSHSPDPMLIVGVIVMICIMIVINLYTLVYWQHPDDKNESILIRIIILTGLQLSSMSVLMIPIDVANNSGDRSCDTSSSTYCGGLDMGLFWQILFCIISFYLVLPIPFATFYYEADDGSLTGLQENSKLWSAVKSEFCLIVIVLLCLVITYYSSSTFTLPVDTYVTSLSQFESFNYTKLNVGQSPYAYINMTLSASQISNAGGYSSGSISLLVNFVVYLIAWIGWVGWWFFSIFAGAGLVVLPFDLILSFIFRPRRLAPDALAQRELEMQERVTELVELCEMLRKDRADFANSSAARAERASRAVTDRVEVNKIGQMVYLCERDMENLRECKAIGDNYNPLIPLGQLLLGVFSTTISILWIVQIILCMLTTPKINGFLNDYFMWFDSWFPMFGNLSYAIFSIYLLFCTIKGCFKLGMKFVCIKIHPMIPGKTYVNSFMFNLAIILICTIPVIQFCAAAFADYARFTDVYSIFNIQITYLNFYSKFYKNRVFVWMLLISAIIHIISCILWPRDRAASVGSIKESLQKRNIRL